ncbi:MAG: uroporphyrinogen-III C-methyltransferase [Bacteroidota bacterium]
MHNGKLILVGAGPGDPELITVKGARVLSQAEVILYDALVDIELLGYAPPQVKKVFVGKRKGVHSFTQEAIHALIRQYTRQGKRVVRLKGGDPLVFARGFEEIAFARQHGIPVEVIPGISSATSLTALQQIPLTRRGISESFWVVTGTTEARQLSRDLELAARSSATVVVLMGVHQLPRIVGLYTELGQAEAPIAVIQNGSRANENMVVSTIRSIEQEVEEAGIGTPAILVIGAVVKLHPSWEVCQLVNELLKTVH